MITSRVFVVSRFTHADKEKSSEPVKSKLLLSEIDTKSPPPSNRNALPNFPELVLPEVAVAGEEKPLLVPSNVDAPFPELHASFVPPLQVLSAPSSKCQ